MESRHRWEGDRVPEGLLRLSVGLEPVEELWRDLEQALRAAVIHAAPIVKHPSRNGHSAAESGRRSPLEARPLRTRSKSRAPNPRCR